MNDPYLNEENCYLRLLEEYKKHNSLTVACDYDNTLFDFHKKNYTFDAVIELLKECQGLNFKLVIFSASPKERHASIFEYCESLGLLFDGINQDVVDWRKERVDGSLDYSQSKIFFNILLDDRAGLESAYKTLRAVVDEIKKHI
jgi:hydroxymethylpyrimidine pyrophosphatase-like HAD family hydrolase